MSFLSIGPTELRILLSIGTLTLFVRPVVSPFGVGPFLLFDLGFGIGAIGLVVALVTSAARTTLALYRAEPLPPPGAAGAAAVMERETIECAVLTVRDVCASAAPAAKAH